MRINAVSPVSAAGGASAAQAIVERGKSNKAGAINPTASSRRYTVSVPLFLKDFKIAVKSLLTKALEQR
jgi:hypothetical protein